MGKRSIVRRMCLDGMLGALYIVLIVFTIRIGNFRITLASLPVVFAAMAFGISDAVAISLIGEFIMQTMEYGITATTALWILPPVLRAITVGLFAHLVKKKNQNLDQQYVLYFVALISGAMFTTAANTLVMWLDALIYQYPPAYIIAEMALRFATSFVSAIVVGIICIPLMRSLRNGKFIDDNRLLEPSEK